MPPQGETTKLTMEVTEGRDHILGNTDAPVTLLEYGDFECPHCGLMHGVLKELIAREPGRFRLVFRHFPLSQMHPHAMHAAEASEAAGAQGRFWEMHDLMFENQSDLEDDTLVQHAAELGLDVKKFVEDADSKKFLARVKEDFSTGIRSGVNGTPTLFLNGKRYNGQRDLESLMAAIEKDAAT